MQRRDGTHKLCVRARMMAGGSSLAFARAGTRVVMARMQRRDGAHKRCVRARMVKQCVVSVHRDCKIQEKHGSHFELLVFCTFVFDIFLESHKHPPVSLSPADVGEL